jgi:PAS domain S-box-containing protein
MDNLPDHIYFKDRESRYVRINQALTRACGLNEPAQAVGRTDFDYFGPECAQSAFADEQEVIRTGRPVMDKEEKNTWPDGREKWVSTTKMPLHDAAKTRRINIGGSENFLAACAGTNVRQVFYLGSNTAYGAHEGNPALFTEDMPLNLPPSRPYN